MNKKFLNILITILLIIMIFTLTGCGNNDNGGNNNGGDKVHQSNSDSKGTKIDWNKDRVGDAITSSDSTIDNISYKVVEYKNDGYFLFLKNNNNFAVSVEAHMDFESGQPNKHLGTPMGYIPTLSANAVGVRYFKQNVNDVASYEIRIETEKREVNDYLNDQKIIERIENNELNIININESNKEIYTQGYIIFYKDSVPVAFDTNRASLEPKEEFKIINKNPVDEKTSEKIEFDDYEIYLESAYEVNE